MRLTTKRLVLRPPKESDIADRVENLNDLNVSCWLRSVPYPYTIKDDEAWIRKSKIDCRKMESYTFVIELKNEGRVIGAIDLHDIDLSEQKAVVAYWLGRRYWGNGYCSEALDDVINFAFSELNLNKLEAGVIVGNYRSIGLLERFGFKQQEYRKKSFEVKATGKIKDEIVYGLSKEKYILR